MVCVYTDAFQPYQCAIVMKKEKQVNVLPINQALCTEVSLTTVYQLLFSVYVAQPGLYDRLDSEI